MKNIKGFTLIELIITLTILSILSVIGFVSFSNYLSSARDTKKIASMKNIDTALRSSFIKTGSYPLPEKYFSIMSGGTVFTMQGGLNENLLGSMKESTLLYSVSENKKYFQLVDTIEKSQNISMTQSGVSFISFGDDIGTVVNKGSQSLIEDVDISNTNQEYDVILSNLILSGTGELLNIIKSGVASDCNEIIKKGYSKGSGIYKILMKDNSIYNVYCDMETQGGGWTLFWSFNKDNHTIARWNENNNPIFTDNYYASGVVVQTKIDGIDSFNISLNKFNIIDGQKIEVLSTIPGYCEKKITQETFLSGKYFSLGGILSGGSGESHFNTYGYAPIYGVTNHFWHRDRLTAGPYIYNENRDCNFGFSGTSVSEYYPNIRTGFIKFDS